MLCWTKPIYLGINMDTTYYTAKNIWVISMISSNIFISYLLFLIREDIIDLTDINRNIIKSPLHMLLASICVTVSNLGVSSGDIEVDKTINRYRNSIVHCEGSANKEIPYNINRIILEIIEKFVIDKNLNHMYFNNFRKDGLEW